MEKVEIVLPGENVDELWVCSDGDGICKKHKKKKEHEQEENISELNNTEDIPTENVLPSRSTDELRVYADGDGICKKPKKKRRHEWEENRFSDLHNVEDNQDESVLQSGNIGELQVLSDRDGVRKEHKKKKRHEREENVLTELHNVKDIQDESVLRSGNTGELQVFSNGDGVRKKHKKKKRHEREENGLTELCNIKDNQDESVLQSENTGELQVFSDGDGICKKHKKKKRHEREKNVLTELHNIKDIQDESALQSGNTGELQVFSNGDGVRKKPKKKKRHEREENGLTELRNIKDNQDESVLQSGNAGELQVFSDGDGVCKKHKKKKRHEREANVLTEFHNVKDDQDESVLRRGITDGLQVSSHRDSIRKKCKKKRRCEKEENSLLEYYGTDENKNESALQCVEDFERIGTEGVPTVKGLSSNSQGETEAEKKYKTFLAEADDVTELASDIRKKLGQMQILVPFEVPESHCIETQFTHVPTEEQKGLLAQLGVQLKYKKFTPSEDAVIRKNWMRFRREYHFEDSDAFTLFGSKHFCHLKYSERKHFVQYLGHGLPHRTLCSIYARFKILYVRFGKGKFTEVEDDLIKTHVSKGTDRQPFSTLSKLFNRDRLSVYKRYKWICEHVVGQGRVSWTLQKAEMVIKSLLKVTGSKNVEDLRNKHFPLSVWRKVEKDCGIGTCCARDIWRFKLSTQLFCPEPLYLNEIRIKLIKRLYRDHVEWWQDIIWADIAKDFGVSPMFLWSLFRKLLKSFFPTENWEYIRTHFRQIIKVLKKQHIATIRGKIKNCRLQRLRMGQDGKLFVLSED